MNEIPERLEKMADAAVVRHLPKPKPCGVRNETMAARCTLCKGHRGDHIANHENGNAKWPRVHRG
jgi:hypothetical protein